MARIFISHSSTNNDKAQDVYDWLVDNGWHQDDIFLDFDPRQGLLPGERWQAALKAAADRCEVVLFLVSQAWAASDWCVAEYLLAKQLGKHCIPLLIETHALQYMPGVMQAEHQGVNLITDRRGYERLKLGLVAAGVDANSFKYKPERPPYPGLRALTEKDPALFFGRDAQIIAGLDKLRLMRSTGVKRMLVILGASGSGKSSLMRAGLWPRLKRDSRNFLPLPVLRPARAILSGESGLYQSLESSLADAARTGQLAAEWPRTRGHIGEYLRQKGSEGLKALLEAITKAYQRPPLEPENLPLNPPTILLFVDQIEELWSLDAGPEATHFIKILGEVLTSCSNLIVVASLRSPSYTLLQNEPKISAEHQELLSLGTMLEGSFRLVIEKPAALVDLKLEPELVDQLLRDAAGQDALPLLAFTMERLYREYGTDGDLMLAEYQKLGGISGAIEDAVKNTFDEARKRGLAADDDMLKQLLKKIFLPHLVRVDDQGSFIRRVAFLEEIPKEARELVKLLADEGQRLLVIDRLGTDQQDIVEVSHEAILREWRLLSGWLLEEREQLVWRQRVEQAYYDYQSIKQLVVSNDQPGKLSKEQKASLLGGKLLETARSNSDWVKALPKDWGDFVKKSIEAADKDKAAERIFQRVAIGAAAETVILFIILFINYREGQATQQKLEQEGRLNLAQYLAAQVRVLNQGSPQSAGLWAAEALAATQEPDKTVTSYARQAANDALITLTGRCIVPGSRGLDVV